jgi:hypothetical protein
LDVGGIVQDKLGTPKAHTLENLVDIFEKLDVIYRLCKFNVSEMTGTEVVL